MWRSGRQEAGRRLAQQGERDPACHEREFEEWDRLEKKKCCLYYLCLNACVVQGLVVAVMKAYLLHFASLASPVLLHFDNASPRASQHNSETACIRMHMQCCVLAKVQTYSCKGTFCLISLRHSSMLVVAVASQSSSLASRSFSIPYVLIFVKLFFSY